MLEHRRQARVNVDIPVMLITVLDMQEGRIVDLSTGGAQIVDASFPKGTRFQIDWQDQTLYAKVRWAEVDRMGVQFEYALTRGPLFDEMARLTAPQEPTRAYVSPAAARVAGFGRRAA